MSAALGTQFKRWARPQLIGIVHEGLFDGNVTIENRPGIQRLWLPDSSNKFAYQTKVRYTPTRIVEHYMVC